MKSKLYTQKNSLLLILIIVFSSYNIMKKTNADPLINLTQKEISIKKRITNPYLGLYLSSLAAANDGDFSKAFEFSISALKNNPKDIELMKNALKMSLYSGEIQQSSQLASTIELNDEKLKSINLIPTIVMQLQRNDIDSAKQVSKLLDVQNHHVLITKVIEAWHYNNLNQYAYSLTILDQLSNDLQDISNEAALFISIQALIISSLNKNLKETQKRYNQVLINFDNFPVRFLLPLAKTIYSNGDKEKGLRLLEENLSKNYDLNKAILFLKNKNNYSSILSISSTIFEAGLMVARSKGFLSAVPYFWCSVELNPDYIESRLLLATFFSEINQHHKALEVLDNNYIHSPYFPLIAFEKSYIYEQLGKFDLAKDVISKFHNHESFNNQAMLRTANILRKENKLSESILIYENLIKNPSPPLETYYFHSVALVQNQDWERAINSLDALINKIPNSAEVLNFVGYILVDKSDRVEEGLSYIEKAIELDPQNGFFLDSLGWAYYKLQKIDKAIYYLERAVELEPQEAEITSHLGDAYWESKRYKEAMVQWKRALTLNGVDILLNEIKSKLQRKVNDN